MQQRASSANVRSCVCVYPSAEPQLTQNNLNGTFKEPKDNAGAERQKALSVFNDVSISFLFPFGSFFFLSSFLLLLLLLFLLSFLLNICVSVYTKQIK